MNQSANLNQPILQFVKQSTKRANITQQCGIFSLLTLNLLCKTGTVHTEEEIANLHGIGKNALEQLKAALKTAGLAFKNK